MDRERLRKEKKWKESDELRVKINKAGYLIEDIEGGFVLKKK